MENYLYTWNPDNWSWYELPEVTQRVNGGEKYTTDWSCGNTKKIQAGDRFFLMRLGVDPKGILGYGQITSDPEYAPHWDPKKKADGKLQLYTDITFAAIDELPILSLHELSEYFPNLDWTPRSSGFPIPEEIGSKLVKLLEAKASNTDLNRDEQSGSAHIYNDIGAIGDHRLARIAYNSAGWKRPTGEASQQETGETYNAQHKFGHEDWLFRNEWQIDGWRYAFIEGFNTKNQTYAGKSLDVSLYTIDPQKKCRLVGTINQAEGLTEEQAKDAVDTFKAKGWFDTMQSEIEAIGGNAQALETTHWAPHILNVRFKLDKVDLYEKETYIEESQWIKNRHRYMLYKFDKKEREELEKAVARRKGSPDAPEVKKLFRKGTKPIEFTPEHQKIQGKLVEELRTQYPKESISCEQDYVDVRVETVDEVIYYEIKTDLDPRSVIRQAMGQLLEYAYHPSRNGRQPDKLVIVGRGELAGKNVEYLNRLSDEFNLPLSYMRVEI